jgi:ABC-type branched-subunit amino acid transport system permease subunit
VAGSEPVTSPDQHKPGHRRAGRVGAIVVALLLVAMALISPNKDVTGITKLWLIGIAAGLLAIVIGDTVLRRNGLR